MCLELTQHVRSEMKRPVLEGEVFHGMITSAPEMRRLFEQVRRVSRSNSTVLIRGETGTGKELVAQALHELGGRSERPFRAINCAVLTPELLASELFGHVRGAFTGATRDRRGLFSLADGGTVFLDEVAEIGLGVQARLLRVLQERTFIPLGGTDPISVDVRLISATHRALREEVEQKRFREDLMYRVRVVPLFLPPLRERRGDVELLTWRFIDAFNENGGRQIEAMDAEVMEALIAYRWPGNVRELRNAIEHAFALGEGRLLTLDELPPELRGEEPVETSDLRALERREILAALQKSGSKKGAAAELLQISRSTLWRKMREHGLR